MANFKQAALEEITKKKKEKPLGAAPGKEKVVTGTSEREKSAKNPKGSIDKSPV